MSNKPRKQHGSFRTAPKEDKEVDIDTLPPEQRKEHVRAMMRMRAIHTLEGYPPYEPVDRSQVEYQTPSGEPMRRDFRGLTKREYIATQVLHAMILHHGLPPTVLRPEMETFSRHALDIANTFITESYKLREADLEQLVTAFTAQFNEKYPPPTPKPEKPKLSIVYDEEVTEPAVSVAYGHVEKAEDDESQA